MMHWDTPISRPSESQHPLSHVVERCRPCRIQELLHALGLDSYRDLSTRVQAANVPMHDAHAEVHGTP